MAPDSATTQGPGPYAATCRVALARATVVCAGQPSRRSPMRAAVPHQWNEPFSVEQVELGPPEQGEVRVKLAASGVCHSDLSIQRGILPMPPPRIIGHEGAGIVEQVGP